MSKATTKQGKPRAAKRKLAPLPDSEVELRETMARHRKGAKAYDKAHFALKEAKGKAEREKLERAKDRNRTHQNAYWRAYNKLALQKASARPRAGQPRTRGPGSRSGPGPRE
jgi:hypothetical protein